MDTVIKAEFNEWRGYTQTITHEQVLQLVGIDYNFKVNGRLTVEGQDTYDFESAQTAPYWVIYRKSSFEQHGTYYYGTFSVIKNNTYASSVYDDCYSSRTEQPISVQSGQPSGDPTFLEWHGEAALGNLIYNITFYDSDTADVIKEDCRVNQTFATIGVSVLINNIPCFMADENNQLDITREDLYMGVAYQNGKFYGEPLDLDNPYTDSQPEDNDEPGPADWSSDPAPMAPLPTDFYGDSGLVTVYTPTPAELHALSNYLWSDNGLDLDQFKKIVNDPFDIILGLNYLPFRVITAGQKPLNVGNILAVDTNLSMTYPTQENYLFDFGSIKLSEQMLAYCDYSPQTRVSLHLPFIGTQTLDIDVLRYGDYNKHTFNLIYKYNIVNGTVIALLYRDDHIPVYSWAGNVATPIPVAANDYTNTINGLIGLATSAVSGAVTGGTIGGPAGAVAGAALGAATSTGNAVSSLKPTITTTGGIGSCGAVLRPTNTAFFIIEQPQMQLDKKYEHYCGLPRNISVQLKSKSATGYNEVESMRLEVNRATQSEKEEILQILKTGYIYGTIKGSKPNRYQYVYPRPTLPSQDDCQIALYQTDSSNIRIDKHCVHLHTYSNIVIKDGTSITNPTIRLKASDDNVCVANYAYIPKFHRYYYIEDVISVSGDIWDLVLRCDVLMSHKSDIIDQYAIMKRSEWSCNKYLNDDHMQIDARPHVYTRAFPNTLTNDGTYVLLVAGGQ